MPSFGFEHFAARLDPQLLSYPQPAAAAYLETVYHELMVRTSLDFDGTALKCASRSLTACCRCRKEGRGRPELQLPHDEGLDVGGRSSFRAMRLSLVRPVLVRAVVFSPVSCNCSVNSLGFAGTLFVKTEAQLQEVKRTGPMTILRSIAAPPRTPWPLVSLPLILPVVLLLLSTDLCLRRSRPSTPRAPCTGHVRRAESEQFCTLTHPPSQALANPSR